MEVDRDRFGGFLRITEAHPQTSQQGRLVTLHQEAKRLRVAVETGAYALFIGWRHPFLADQHTRVQGFTAAFTVLRLLTPLGMSYAAAKKRTESKIQLSGMMCNVKIELR